LGLTENLAEIQGRIQAACARAHRSPESVLLLPASKTQSIEAIQELYDLGVRDFAESRVQELLKKKDQLPADIHWHFIGHLQSNKVKYLTPFVESIESIDSLELAEEISRRPDERKIRILLEVNISGEEQKHGFQPSEVEDAVARIAKDCANLILSGLMGMASYEEDIERTRPQFVLLRKLRDEIAERHSELKAFTELSMGMSNDFEVAIEEGATIVRIGSALFGERT
jgi:pyridoxal phosphate enzyme (YggS family)